MPNPGEITTAESCRDHLRAVLDCLDTLVAAEPRAAARETLTVAAIHVQQAIELIHSL